SSPFSLMYACKVNMPENYIRNNYPIQMTVDGSEERVKYMENSVFPAITERTTKINEVYAKRYDKKNTMLYIYTDESILIGLQVMITLKRRANELAPIYEGPYT
ncbi:hypothetical protein BDB01DRAFT_715795, partial [Pilobolus umbonatus]